MRVSTRQRAHDRAVRCAGKQPHASFAIADAIATRMRHRKSKVRVSVYRCEECQRWHIGEKLDSSAVVTAKREVKQ